ncbi:MAG: phenylalanine--tRNA ligase subunit beta [Bacilli bacterium]
MKLSRKWLEEYIDIAKLTDVEIAEGLTRSGIEVEKINRLVDTSELIVAMIVDVAPHPNADKLSICTIDIGNNNTLDIVCGASNVREYSKVAYAPVGTIINGNEIIETKIRGVLSSGMLCSMEEIGIPSSIIEDSQKEGIAILPNSFELGENVIELLELNDTVFELSLTPNRSDCLNIIGIAYEVSAIFDIPLKKRTIRYPEIENDSNLLNLLVSNDKVKYFSLMPLHNIRVGESPHFIKARLIASGIKPINNVVDITNYILIETGQPLHAFDLLKATTNFEVRSAFKNEKIKLLNENEYELSSEDIVVSNQGTALSLAGVMGGHYSRVTKYTENIVLECAIFDAESVRQTSKKYNFRSESSIRFEKGLDVGRVDIAMKMAVELLVKYAGAKLSTNPVVYEANDFKFDDSSIILNYDKLAKYIGFNIDVNEVAKILDRLQLSFTFEDSKFKVKKLSRRPDLQFDVCIIEEIIRIYGVGNIEGILPTTKIKRSYITDYDRTLTTIKNILHGMGYSECINYSLTSKEKASIVLNENEELIRLKNPLSSEREYFRKSLIPTMIDTATYNLERQFQDVRLYEISQINYLLDGNYIAHNKITAIISGFNLEKPLFDVKIKGDFYLIKGALQKLFSMAGLTEGIDYLVAPSKNIPEIFHPYQSAEVILSDKVVGYIGKIHPKYSKHELYVFELDFYELKQIFSDNFTLGEISIYPSVTRDLSIVVDEDINSIEMIKSVHDLNIDVLEYINLYNIYKDEKLKGKKSLTFRLVFRSDYKTLSEDIISDKLNLITDCFRSYYNGELR